MYAHHTSHCLHCWGQDKAKTQLCIHPHSTRLPWTAPRAGDEGARLSSIVRCCSTQTMGRQLGTSAEGCFPLPLRREALPGSCSNPNYVSGWFLIPSPPWPPWGAEALSCHPSPHSAPTSGDICLLRPMGALMARSVPVWVLCWDTLL